LSFSFRGLNWFFLPWPLIHPLPANRHAAIND
jgi:hypothetical protein